MLTEAAKEAFKQFIETNIGFAMVTVNGVAERRPIHRKERLTDGRVAAYVSITPQLETGATIENVQLYNPEGQLWVEKAESIYLASVQEGVLYRFVFDFIEREV